MSQATSSAMAERCWLAPGREVLKLYRCNRLGNAPCQRLDLCVVTPILLAQD